MPKDYIITDETQRRTDRHGGRQEAVRVGWSVGDQRSLQIATVLMHCIEGSTSSQLTTDPASDEFVDVGQFVDLDRDATNKLIRTLRRARDAAFGADA